VRAFFFPADDGIRDFHVTGVQTCSSDLPGEEARRARPTVRAAAGASLLRAAQPAGAFFPAPPHTAGRSDRPPLPLAPPALHAREIGRASCRARAEPPAVGVPVVQARHAA